jgi:hypothetical protein
MSSTTGTRPALQPPGGQASPGPPAGQEQGATLGLVSATGLVMGSIIGVGVFTMPAVLAAAGTSSLAVMAVVAAGAMLLAVLFGQLTRRVPNADGGLYAYARHEFGDFAGYITGWTDRHGSAWFGIVLAALLPSLLLLWRYASSSGLTVYPYLVDLTVVAVALPYLFSGCAQLTYLVSKRRPVQAGCWPGTCRSPGPARCSRCGSPSPPATRPSTRPWSSCWPASSCMPS